MSEVVIAPANTDDARTIASELEKISPWPGYGLKAAPWPQPNRFVVSRHVADILLARLYANTQHTHTAQTIAAQLPELAQSSQPMPTADKVDSPGSAGTEAAITEPTGDPPKKRRRKTT